MISDRLYASSNRCVMPANTRQRSRFHNDPLRQRNGCIWNDSAGNPDLASSKWHTPTTSTQVYTQLRSNAAFGESVIEKSTFIGKRGGDVATNHPTRDQMDKIFGSCRKDDWTDVLQCVKRNPQVAVTPMIMDNHIPTTIIHQAITSKGNIQQRSDLIQAILAVQPDAAAIKNGYGSLPLHVISQRNTKMTASIKEQLIYALVTAYPQGLAEEGGVGKRTPIHVLFTDYISLRLTRLMVEACPEATFMKDKKGYLPAHVACSRHCSPLKLQILLQANPSALYDCTNAGHTLLWLATTTATKSHPNYALIDAIKAAMRNCSPPDPNLPKMLEPTEPRVNSSSKYDAIDKEDDDNTNIVVGGKRSCSRRLGRCSRHDDDNEEGFIEIVKVTPPTSLRLTTIPSSKDDESRTYYHCHGKAVMVPTPSPHRHCLSLSSSCQLTGSPLLMDDSTPVAANLLLHFHRNGSPVALTKSQPEPLPPQLPLVIRPLPPSVPPPSHYYYSTVPLKKRRKLIHYYGSYASPANSNHIINNNHSSHCGTRWTQSRFAEV